MQHLLPLYLQSHISLLLTNVHGQPEMHTNILQKKGEVLLVNSLNGFSAVQSTALSRVSSSDAEQNFMEHVKSSAAAFHWSKCFRWGTSLGKTATIQDTCSAFATWVQPRPVCGPHPRPLHSLCFVFYDHLDAYA